MSFCWKDCGLNDQRNLPYYTVQIVEITFSKKNAFLKPNIDKNKHLQTSTF